MIALIVSVVAIVVIGVVAEAIAHVCIIIYVEFGDSLEYIAFDIADAINVAI